jgi:hypothetical protein
VLVRYYSRALAEKALTFVPLGKSIYLGIGAVVNRRSKGTVSIWTSYRLTKKAKELIPPGGRVLDIGTAWFHHDAFLLWLVGDYEIHLFDVEDKAKIGYIKNYLRYLIKNIDEIAREFDIDRDHSKKRLEALLELPTREEIYKACNFVPCIVEDPTKPFLPEKSIDFMISNCVLNHIPYNVLAPEMYAFRKMLKDDGAIYCLLGHDDHWAFHDPYANQFNFYQYSDRYYKAIFESFEYHNRFVKSEWMEFFDKCGFEVADYYPHITEESKEEIRKLPYIDPRFAKYPLEELAIVYSYVLLRKRALVSANGSAKGSINGSVA